MKNKILTGALAFVSIATAFVLGMTTAEKSATPRPALKKDTSPISEGKSPVVASYADVVEPVERVVVSVYSSKTVRVPVNPLLRQFFGNQIPDQERKEDGLGSGVIVSSDGYILTNNHVVEGADELTVALQDDRKFKARVIGTDAKTDIAVIKIEAKELPSITLADSDKLRVGDIVFAVGNPLGVGETVTMGIVSAKGRSGLGLLENGGGYEDFIQTDAAINMGNSGGALVDAKGRLVGINSAIISPSRGNVGIGFAIPVNLAANVMQSLIATGTVTRGYLGVSTQPITSDIADQLNLPKNSKGVIVTDITPGSPADKAGLKNSDVILSINGKAVTTTEELRILVAQMLPKTKISLAVIREGKASTVAVVLDELADKPNEILAGVETVKLTDDYRSKLGIDPRVNGFLITSVEPKSIYADRLAANMVIMEINRTAPGDITTAKNLLVHGRNLLFVYFRGSAGFLTLDVK
jgi:serine protease Do/serine protease DegQ